MVRQGDILFTLDARAIEAQLASSRRNAGQGSGPARGRRARRCAATPTWSPRARPRSSIWTMPRPRSDSSRRHQGRPGVDRKSQSAARLLHHQGPDQRARQHGGGEGRQFRAPGRPDADRHDHPDGAGLRHVLVAAKKPARFARTRSPTNPPISRPSFPAIRATANGQVTMIENTVDPTTGTVPVRATMPNTDEILWPGTLVTVRLTFREEEAVTVPSTAVQVEPGRGLCVRRQGRRRQRAAGQGRAHARTPTGSRERPRRRRDRRDRRAAAAERTARRSSARQSQSRGLDHESLRDSASAVRCSRRW